MSCQQDRIEKPERGMECPISGCLPKAAPGRERADGLVVRKLLTPVFQLSVMCSHIPTGIVKKVLCMSGQRSPGSLGEQGPAGSGCLRRARSLVRGSGSSALGKVLSCYQL